MIEIDPVLAEERRCVDRLPFRNFGVAPEVSRGIGSFCLIDQKQASHEDLNNLRRATAEAVKELPSDEALDVIYPAEHGRCAIRSLVSENNVKEKVGDTRFAALVVDGNDPRSVAARRVEAQWFEDEFGTHPSDHERSHNKYSDSSLFILMLDMADPEEPVAAGVLRCIKPSEVGLKTVNILASDTVVNEEAINPWHDDFAAKIPGYDQADQQTREQLIYKFFGTDPSSTWDVPTMAVDKKYKGHSADEFTPAYGLYAACMQVAIASGARSFINTQDVKPLRLMQYRFGSPWTDKRTKDEDGEAGRYGFTAVPYEGPEPVVPTCLPDLVKFKSDICIKKPDECAKLFDPNTYSALFMTPLDLQADRFNQLHEAA